LRISVPVRNQVSTGRRGEQNSSPASYLSIHVYLFHRKSRRKMGYRGSIGDMQPASQFQSEAALTPRVKKGSSAEGNPPPKSSVGGGAQGTGEETR